MYRNINFSLWCDFLERDFIDGEFTEMLKKKYVNGATSNPTIFSQAICSSKAYLSQKEDYKRKSPKKLYEILALTDIKKTAIKLLKDYASANDGFVSLEIDPNLYDDTLGSLGEAKRLFNKIKMPNVMMKLPATKSSYEAMSELMKNGINVNATLVFSISQVNECLEAMREGSKAYLKRFSGTPAPKGVISVFVSRFDRLLDDKLKKSGLDSHKFGIYNASKAYDLVCNSGLDNVKTLFASTGVKGGLPKDYYIKELLYSDSINTAPLESIKEFIKHRYKQKKIPADIDTYFTSIKDVGIDYEETCQKLLKDGLSAFCKSFDEILGSLK